MKKIILASVTGFALMGLAACSDTDGTTTQSVPPESAPMTQEAPSAAPAPNTTPATPPPAAPAN